MTDLTKLVVRLSAEIGEYTQGLQKGIEQLAKFEEGVKDKLEEVANLFLGFFTIEALTEWGKSVLEQGDRLVKFSQSAGVSIESLSRLEYALKSSGVQADSLGGIFRKLNDSISDAAGDATSHAATAFDLLGIKVKDSSGALKSADQLLPEIADKFAAAGDGANKSALAVALLGREGATAIPFLNQGADGIKRLGDEADALGITLDSKTAKAAEEFVSQMERLKTTLVDGIGNRVEAQILPIFKELGDTFGSTAEKTQALDEAATVAASAIKILATAGLYIVTEFEEAGDSIGGAVAALNAIVHGNFSEVSAIFADNDARLADMETKFQQRLAIIWKDGGAAVAAAAEDTAKKASTSLGNLAAAIKAGEDQRKGLEALKAFADQLGEQIAGFDKSKDASAQYRLEQGNLAKSLKDAGDAGVKYKGIILDLAKQLDNLGATDKAKKAIEEITESIDKLNGNDGAAALASIDKKYGDILANADKAGAANTEQLRKQIDALVTATAAQADFNDSIKKANELTSDLSNTEARLTNAVALGTKTELGAQQDLQKARAAAADQLQAVADAQLKIYNQTGNAEQLRQYKDLEVAVESLRAKSDEAAQSIRKGFETDIEGPLLDLEKGVKNLGDAFQEFIDNLAEQFLKLANQQIVQSLLGSLFGAGTAGGGFLSRIAAGFGGARAAGGPVTAGMAYQVNENTPNSEWFVPNMPGTIIPHEKMARTQGASITQNFMIQAPQGSVSRATQLQTGLAAARGIQTSQRRNG